MWLEGSSSKERSDQYTPSPPPRCHLYTAERGDASAWKKKVEEVNMVRSTGEERKKITTEEEERGHDRQHQRDSEVAELQKKGGTEREMEEEREGRNRRWLPAARNRRGKPSWTLMMKAFCKL